MLQQVVAAHGRNVLRFVRAQIELGADAVCLQARDGVPGECSLSTPRVPGEYPESTR